MVKRHLLGEGSRSILIPKNDYETLKSRKGSTDLKLDAIQGLVIAVGLRRYTAEDAIKRVEEVLRG